MRAIPFEEFVKRARAVHGDDYSYENDTYTTLKKKLWMTHKVCGTRFQQSGSKHLKGQGCPVCAKEYTRTLRKSNYNAFIQKAMGLFGDRYEFPNIKNEYENSHSKITVRCRLCGNTFIKIACDFVTSETGGCWCKEKADEYVTYNDLNGMLNNATVTMFDGKKHKNERTEVTCDVCGYVSHPYTYRIMDGTFKCGRCAKSEAGKKRHNDPSEMERKLIEINPTVTPLMETYKRVCQKMKMRCNICGHEFERTPNAVFSGVAKTPCPNCTKKDIALKRTKSDEEFKRQVDERYGVGEYELLSPYVRSSEKVHVRHNKCGREFWMEANSFLFRYGCPYHHRNKSLMEEEIADFIIGLGERVLTSDRTILNGYELDMYLPDKNIAIEFDGIFWHNENNKENDYHLSKTLKCNENNIRLIHVFEDEWRDKQDIWKSMLKNILGHTEKRVYARKCVLKEVEPRECNRFLNENHLQGSCGSTIKLGLYKDGELVSVMTFGKSRHFIGNGCIEYELLRFCNKKYVNVVGGASKLFSHFVKTYKPNEVVSYADRRWSTGNLYEKLGFNFMNFSRPNYFYIIKDKRKNRFCFRKSVLKKKYGCPDNVTEKDFCRQMGWPRIYDCGTLVYKWIKQN